MTKIDKSKIDIDDFKRILELGGGSYKGFSEFVGRSPGYYYDRLVRDQRLSEADKSQLEKYLISIGGKTTFEDAYNAMLNSKKPKDENK